MSVKAQLESDMARLKQENEDMRSSYNDEKHLMQQQLGVLSREIEELRSSKGSLISEN